MNPSSDSSYIAFEGDRCIASGDLRDVARAAKETLERRKDASILVFDGITSAPDRYRFSRRRRRRPGAAAESPARPPLATKPRRRRRAVPAARNSAWSRAKSRCCRGTGNGWRGRPGGASVAIRRLVEEARRTGEDKDRIRQAQEAAYRFMSAMAGNRPHYEDAIRALFADDPAGFEKLIAGWPADVRDHASRLAERAFQRATGPHG